MIYEPLLVVPTEDRVKSHNHVDILEVRAEAVVESVQDQYIYGLIGVIRCI